MRRGAELVIENLSMGFSGLRAVDGLSMQVRPGEIVALIGPNGAGKTTTFNCISGLLRPTGGRIVYDGRDITGWPPHRLAPLGLLRTFQNVRLFGSLSVLENVMMGRYARTRAGLVSSCLALPWARSEMTETVRAARRTLRLVGLEQDEATQAGSLPFGRGRLVELARAAAAQPRLMLLDEPAAGLNRTESRELGRIIRLCRDRGASILLIEHDVRLVMDIAERVAVMDFGRLIAEGPPEQIRRDPQVQRAYLGEEASP